MKIENLQLLRCPFCGGRFTSYPGKLPAAAGADFHTGVLGCACSAYPVVAGIPYIRTGPTARTVLQLLDKGENQKAFHLLLGISSGREQEFEALCRDENQFTFKNSLEFLSPNPEGTYFLYRFSDPTFLVSDGLLRAVAADHISGQGPIIDLCGGSGHLTRTLCEISGDQPVWLADFEFWKLWLAKQFIAPEAQPLCCDAAQPLPFSRNSFAFCICSDAFPFLWSRRLLAGEMRRLVGPEGALMATHLHNVRYQNSDEVGQLEPAIWRGLFEEAPARLFKESDMLNSILACRPIDLSIELSDEEVGDEPALIALSTTRPNFFRQYNLPESKKIFRRPSINPLYRSEVVGSAKVLNLAFPSALYEFEFRDCRRYLPNHLECSAVEFQNLPGTTLHGQWTELAQKRILLDLPERYL